MNVRYKNGVRAWKNPAFCLLAIFTGFFGSCQFSQAQQSAQDSLLFADSSKQINWIPGPQSITVGNYADIQIPDGYRWADMNAARAILESAGNRVPSDLIGVIAPASGKWWAVMEFIPDGYVKTSDLQQIDSSAVLKVVQGQLNLQNDDRASQGMPLITSMNWQDSPAYDQHSSSLTWSLLVETPSMKSLNQSIVVPGRHGFFQITAVQTYPVSENLPLKQLAANISFKNGERYSDYQSGDEVASFGLAELIVGEKHLASTGIFSRGFSGATAAAVYAGLGGCILAGGLVVLLRKKGRRHSKHSHARVPAAAAVAPAAAISTAAPSNGTPVAAGNGHQDSIAPGAANGVADPKKPMQRTRRKRSFDYPKFYTSVMKELSLHSYGPSLTIANGRSRMNGHANGHANGHTNGNGNDYANGHSNGHANGNGNGHANGTNGVSDAIKAEISELISSQKNLIQEQKCLLEQQTKLISEKRWLIEEQTAFLKSQTDQQFPLKFE